LHADIAFLKDTIRVYTTHLASLRFRKEDYETIEDIKDKQTVAIQSSKGIFGKVRRALRQRKEQALLIKEVVSNDPYPSVLTGDFNDVPNSFAYATIKGDLYQDVFLKKALALAALQYHFPHTSYRLYPCVEEL
jgi:endonuclease/exonuclease/phosphatase family metal-dependent hydrolase